MYAEETEEKKKGVRPSCVCLPVSLFLGLCLPTLSLTSLVRLNLLVSPEGFISSFHVRLLVFPVGYCVH